VLPGEAIIAATKENKKADNLKRVSFHERFNCNEKFGEINILALAFSPVFLQTM
jgi:hypothetical protein